jgi:hypothetical protein
MSANLSLNTGFLSMIFVVSHVHHDLVHQSFFFSFHFVVQLDYDLSYDSCELINYLDHFYCSVRECVIR